MTHLESENTTLTTTQMNMLTINEWKKNCLGNVKRELCVMKAIFTIFWTVNKDTDMSDERWELDVNI